MLLSTTCKLLLLGMVLMAFCTMDAEAWRRRRRRGWFRRAWRWVKEHVTITVGASGTFSAADCAQLDIIYRGNWSAGPQSGSPQTVTQFNKVYVYDAGSNTCYDEASCIKLLRVMQDADRQDGYTDIKSNFLVGQDGQLYEGRGWDVRGDYERTDENDLSIGLAFMGDFSDTAPNQASFDAVRKFVGCSARLMPNTAIDVKQGTTLYDVIVAWGQQNP